MYAVLFVLPIHLTDNHSNNISDGEKTGHTFGPKKMRSRINRHKTQTTLRWVKLFEILLETKSSQTLALYTGTLHITHFFLD